MSDIDRAGQLDALIAELRLMPDEKFKARLKSQLLRRPHMTAATTTAAAIREGFHTVTPYVAVVEAERLIDFLKHTFGAVETLRHSVSPGQFHSEVRLADSMLMIGSGERLRGKENRTALHIFVPDCDAAYARALEAGATSMGEPADRPYGERSGYVKDATGNIFFIATRLSGSQEVADTPKLMPFFYPLKAIPYIEFLERAFGATRLGVYQHEGHVVHAAVRIGDAVIEMGEAGDQRPDLQSSYFMYVKDVDAVYANAITAGATSIHPPTDQPYGHREAALKDPAGYVWYPATLL